MTRIFPLLLAIAIGSSAATQQGSAQVSEVPPRVGVQRAPGSVIGHRGAPGTAAQAGRNATKQPPCWQEAGISKGAMQQRRAIEEQTRAKVESVCADPSLTEQQKRQEIKQIHEQAHQETMGLISPAQQQALHECQAARSKENPHPGGPHASLHHGPCD